ncbi:MAG: hypothetical protein ABL921_02755 [Pirellula sp.]
MVPVLINCTGRWLDRFSDVLGRWESTLNDVQVSYLLGDFSRINELCPIGENIHDEIKACKDERQRLLDDAAALGYTSKSLRELAQQLDTQWPSLWTHRLASLELQLSRIQQLSMSLWVSAFQSKSFVSELLLILSTGKADSATYAPSESHSLEGGFLINEAA